MNSFDEIRKHNIEKAISNEFGFDVPMEEIVKGKGHPLGTKRVWGGVEYEKKPEGWMPTGKKEKVEKQDQNDPVIKDPDNFKVTSSEKRQINQYNPKYYEMDYKINGVVVCTVKKYSDMFCSVDRSGRPSNIRDTHKTCYSTRWDRTGVEKVTGLKTSYDDFSSRRGGRFGDSYPDTTWGSTGGMESASGIKEKVSAFMKEKQKSKTEFSDLSDLTMTQTSRATYTSTEPMDTTLKELKNGKWEFSDEDIEKLKRGETLTKQSPNGMNKISLTWKK